MILAASTVELMLRMLVSLAVIAAVTYGLYRLSRHRLGLGAARADISVHARHQLGRAASIAVVRAGERYFLVGVTEHGVNLLAEGPDLVAAGDSGPLPAIEIDAGTGPGTGAGIVAGRPSATGPRAPVPASRNGTGRRPASRGREGAQLRARRADGGGRGGAGKRHRRADGPAPSGMSVIEALRERTVRRN